MQHRYFSAIDGVRAIAVLAVMVFHLEATLLPGGFTGVDIFFVISGYVVARSLMQHGDTAFLPYLASFYRRRVLRLLPALAVCLSVTAVLVIVFIPQAWLSQSIATTGLAAFFGVSNIALANNTDSYFSPAVEFNPFVHTWSLGVEEQFYLIFPLLFYFYLQQKSRFALAGLALVSLALSTKYSTSDTNAAYYLLTSRFWELAAGALLCQWHASRPPRSGRLAHWWLAAGGVLVVAGLLLARKDAFPMPWALLPVTGTVLMLHGIVARGADHHAGILQLSALRYIGRLSYSLYLWHWPVFTFFRWSVGLQTYPEWLAAALLTFSLAALSYHAIESRLSHWPRLRQLPPARLLTGAAAGVVALSVTAHAGFANQPQLSQSVTSERAIWYPHSNPSKLPDATPLPDLAGRTLWVIGDSHAGAYGSMLKLLSRQTGISINIMSQGGCGLANLREPVLDGDAPCAQKLARWLEKIEQQASDRDIIFLASLKAYRFTNQYRMQPSSLAEVHATINSPAARQQRQHALAESQQVLSRLSKVTRHIVIDAPKPVFGYIPFRCADWFNHTNPTCQTQRWQPRFVQEATRAPVLENLKQLADQFAAVQIWDPLPTLCSDYICPVYVGQKPLYFDGDHLSGYGNQVLYPSFTAALRRMLIQA